MRKNASTQDVATTRAAWVPPGATIVRDKMSDAVAYLYTDAKGRPCARVFYGRQGKPVAAFWYRSDSQREKDVTRYFATRRDRQAQLDARAKDRADFVHAVKVGDMFKTCWGYDQTNVEFFEAVAISGTMLTLREVRQESVSTDSMHGRCVPLPGDYIGAPIRRRAGPHGVRIDDVRFASHYVPMIIGGVPSALACPPPGGDRRLERQASGAEDRAC